MGETGTARGQSKRQEHSVSIILRRINLYKVIVHLLKVDYFYNDHSAASTNGDYQIYVIAKNIRINAGTDPHQVRKIRILNQIEDYECKKITHLVWVYCRYAERKSILPYLIEQ